MKRLRLSLAILLLAAAAEFPHSRAQSLAQPIPTNAPGLSAERGQPGVIVKDVAPSTNSP